MFKSARVAGLIGLSALTVACSGAATSLSSRPADPAASLAASTDGSTVATNACPMVAGADRGALVPGPPTRKPLRSDPVNFQDWGQSFVDPASDRYSTFAMDGRRITASYSITELPRGRPHARSRQRSARGVRQQLRLRLRAAERERLRDQPSMADRRPFTEAGSILLRVGIQARQVSEAARLPVSLTFVIDTLGFRCQCGRSASIWSRRRSPCSSRGFPAR